MVLHLNPEMSRFIESQRTDNTRRAYRQDLVAWVRYLDGRTLDEDIIIEWRDSIGSGATALRRYNTVRTFYRWSGMNPNPFERVKAPRRVSDWSPIVPDESKVDALLGVCRTPKDRVIIALLNNGLRAQEVVDLKAEDYYYDERYRTHIMRVTGKGMKMRLVPANSQTVEALAAITLPIKKLNIRKIYYVIERLSKEAGIEGLHPHALRHGYATRLIRAGVPVFSLQRLLGHARAETTGVYVNLDLSDLVLASQADPRNIINVTNTVPMRLLSDVQDKERID